MAGETVTVVIIIICASQTSLSPSILCTELPACRWVTMPTDATGSTHHTTSLRTRVAPASSHIISYLINTHIHTFSSECENSFKQCLGLKGGGHAPSRYAFLQMIIIQVIKLCTRPACCRHTMKSGLRTAWK